VHGMPCACIALTLKCHICCRAGLLSNIHDCVGRSNWMLWVPAQCINFGLVAQPYQVGRLVCCTLPVTASRSAAATTSLPALRIRPITRLLTLAT